MSNTLHNIRQYMIDTFVNGFAPTNPNVPIRHENIRFEHLDVKKPFIDLREEAVIEHAAALGGRHMRKSGMFVIEALGPEDTGTISLRQYISEAEDIFRNHQGVVADVGYLSVKHSTYNQVALNKGLYSLSIVVHYQIDLCH